MIKEILNQTNTFANATLDRSILKVEITKNRLYIIIEERYYIKSLNFNNNGEIISGNLSRFQTTITGSLFCDSFPKDLTYSCVWHYSVRSGATDMRSGTINACWDDTGTLLSHSDVSTVDIGDTSDINFDVNMDGGNTFVRLFANCVGTWNIRLVRIDI